jgi:hypothetical protein
MCKSYVARLLEIAGLLAGTYLPLVEESLGGEFLSWLVRYTFLQVRLWIFLLCNHQDDIGYRLDIFLLFFFFFFFVPRSILFSFPLADCRTAGSRF